MNLQDAAAPRVVYVVGMPFSVKPETAVRMLISRMAKFINHETIELTEVGTGRLDIPTPKSARSPVRERVFNSGDPGSDSTTSVMRYLSTSDGCVA